MDFLPVGLLLAAGIAAGFMIANGNVFAPPKTLPAGLGLDDTKQLPGQKSSKQKSTLTAHSTGLKVTVLNAGAAQTADKIATPTRERNQTSESIKANPAKAGLRIDADFVRMQLGRLPPAKVDARKNAGQKVKTRITARRQSIKSESLPRRRLRASRGSERRIGRESSISRFLKQRSEKSRVADAPIVQNPSDPRLDPAYLRAMNALDIPQKSAAWPDRGFVPTTPRPSQALRNASRSGLAGPRVENSSSTATLR